MFNPLVVQRTLTFPRAGMPPPVSPAAVGIALTFALMPSMVRGFCTMQSHFLKVEYKLPSRSVPVEHAIRVIHTPERLFKGGEYAGLIASILRCMSALI